MWVGRGYDEANGKKGRLDWGTRINIRSVRREGGGEAAPGLGDAWLWCDVGPAGTCVDVGSLVWAVARRMPGLCKWRPES